MAFQDVWNTAYEGIPPDTENINLGANRIRDLKVNTRERGGTDHSWGDTADNGQHNRVSFNPAAGDPAAAAPTSFLYTKSTSGISELFWEDSNGNIVQITASGSINARSFPAGTVMNFLMASPPTGWNQYGGWGDAVIRLVADGSGGAVGGGWAISGLQASAGTGSLSASSSSNSSGSVSGTVAGHALSVGELPSHTHNFVINTGGSGNGGPQTGQYNAVQAQSGYTTDGGTGGNGAHAHGWSGTISVSTSTSTSISGAPSVSVSGDGSWRPLYVNSCVGIKT